MIDKRIGSIGILAILLMTLVGCHASVEQKPSSFIPHEDHKEDGYTVTFWSICDFAFMPHYDEPTYDDRLESQSQKNVKQKKRLFPWMRCR